MKYFWLMLALLLTGCAGWEYKVGVTYPPPGLYFSITPPVKPVAATQPTVLAVP